MKKVAVLAVETTAGQIFVCKVVCLPFTADLIYFIVV